MIAVVVFALAAGAAALARVMVAEAANTARFPWGTMAVNVAGSFVAGVLAGHLSEQLATVVVVAGLGSFTTFSTFTVEAATLWSVRRSAAAAYVLATAAGAVGAALLGLRL